MTCHRRGLVLVGLAVLATPSVFAIVPREGLPGLEPPRPLLQETVSVADRPSPAFADFLASAGGAWEASIDLRTGRPSLVSGSGIPWVPGKGNDLAWSDLTPGAVGPPSDKEILGLLEARARGFLGEQEGLLGLESAGADLVLDPRRSGSIDRGRVRYLTLEVRRGGVPVDRASVVFRLSHGNLVQFGAAFVADSLAGAPTAPSIGADRALASAASRLDRAWSAAHGAPTEDAPPPSAELSEIVEPGRLLLRPSPSDAEDGSSLGLDYRLIWRVAFRTRLGHETWTAEVDAVSGEVLALWDDNRYACPEPARPRGRVTGGVYIGAIEEVPESTRGLQFAAVENGGPLVTDYNGSYDYRGDTPARTGLDGRFVDMNCVGCNNPPQADVVNESWGDLDLGFGGADQNGNGLSTRAERNCYYHINHVRMQASKHLDDATVNGFFDDVLPANVNINDSCNAFWNGNSINFFRSSGACNNTGDIADVMQHEWGHGLDSHTGGIIDGGRSEGLSDVVAILATHDPRLAPYFYRGNAAGIRNADETVSRRGVMTFSALNGICGGQVHCEGELFSQVFWHLARLLRADALARTSPPSEQAGWYVTERLFYQSLPISDTFAPNQTGSTYDAVILIDDDDGNLNNGTPNAEFINEAFSHHEIESRRPSNDSPPCPAPAAPALTAVARVNAATTLWQVQLDWTAVAGASQYDVYRNDDGSVGGDVLVATLFPPTRSFFDDNVTDGVTYAYRVQAFEAGGCFSIDDNRQTIAVPGLVRLNLNAFGFDDRLGNANGLADPGEELTLRFDVTNVSSLRATAVQGSIETTDPRVTIVDGTAAFGDVAAGATASPGDPFVVRLDPGLTCGDRILFTASAESAEGCSRGSFVVDVGELLGFDLLHDDDVETDRGWVVDPLGPDPNLTAGGWERADPEGTGAQPEDDHTPGPGTTCWVTGAQAGNRDGAFDVDGGCTVLQSPVMSIGGQPDTELSYWRFFSIATSFDDEFVVEISNDGGANWIELERLAGSEPAWTEVVRSLDQLFGEPADRVVLRFTACDADPGSLLEALVDDVSIRRALFRCEAPDPRPRLQVVAELVGDGTPLGGRGNANGFAEPGEAVVVAIDVENVGNETATRIAGPVRILSAPPGVRMIDSDADWADLAAGLTGRTAGASPQHVSFLVPATVTCGAQVLLEVEVFYEGPVGSYSVGETFTVPIGGRVETEVFFDDFEGGDNGWTHGSNCLGGGCDDQDDWQHGVPAGAVPSDPSAAFSGTRVWGNDLGVAPWNGDYRPNIDNYLESPALDFSGLTGATISFQRWLGVEDGTYDRARILVNGTEIWRNPVGADLLDAAWTPQLFDVSRLADGGPARVRFELASDGGLEYGGWALDDFRAFVSDWRCEVADCGGLPCIESDCNDGLDDDGDGAIDCRDSDCDSGCVEINCNDGLDDDGDGLADCLDADCAASCGESNCNDGLDDDGDGFIDCDDAECAGRDDVDCDGDGVLALLDCDDADAGVAAIPFEVPHLDVRDVPGAPLMEATLDWLDVGLAAGPDTLHDVLTGSLPDLHRDGGIGGASCLGSVAAVSLPDGRDADAGGTWYLVRGRNACGLGELGNARSTPATCP